ncbi:hybrid sensor histidine kinase/response regulator [Paenibacillus chibensis]|uniref:hybrid sensor histidine kinase/response regulator n=1 Tax=Paenibacillus chibensis TaxID=59846 RepID=UPI0013E4099A|nr:ATP-binding protein [Paenibacillus chibensis]MEC0368927.1 ATP-binding protein [Paenibacillus chibensis]
MSQGWRKKLAVLVGLFLIAGALFIPMTDPVSAKKNPRAVDGILDLTHWSLKDEGPVQINGRWSLYWKELLTKPEMARADATKPIFAEVPGEWEKNGLPGRGYATYRLTIRTSGDDGTLALRIPAISPAYRLFVDDRLIAETGVVSSERASVQAAYLPQTISFDPPGGTFDLYIQIANELYPEGGIWFGLTLGTEHSMLFLKQRTDIVEISVFGGCTLLGLYQIALYAMRRSDRSTLYFGICCLLGAIRIGAVGEMYIVRLYPHIDIRALIFLEYLTFYGGVTAALLFAKELYPKEYHTAVTKSLAVIGCGFIGTVLLLPTEWYTRFMEGYKYVSIVSLAYILFGIVLAFWRGRGGAVLQLIGWLIFIGAALHDILYSVDQVIWSDIQLVPYGFILLVFIEALELARRFTNAYRVIGDMSEQLLASNRMKDEFLANTSHELKTPLHGIMNLSLALTEERSGPLNERQREQLEVVVAVARRLSNLINDILDLSRLKNSGIQLELGAVDIRAVVSSQRDVFLHYIGDKPVALRFDWPEALPRVYADESRLLQMVYNLIGNAIKFTPEGEVAVSAWAEGGMLHMAVADTGIGIEEDKLDAIFESFEQVGTSVAREYGGAGLGLGITKRLVELHGGRISVTSQLGRGSVFTVSLPVSGNPFDRKAESRSIEQSQAASIMSSGLREIAVTAAAVPNDGAGVEREHAILAVDDDPVNLRVLQAVLADEPFEFIAVSSGKEALDMLERFGSKIGLVILDVMMPGQSGFETCRQIRKTYSLSELPVLLTTVRNDPSDVMIGFEAGANDYLTKPFQPYELRARTRTLLQMKRSAEDAVRSELAFLQAQIKPHFLYNALNTIVTFSLEDPQMTQDLLLNLGRYLRGSFDFKSKERLVSLQRELELTEAYLRIEQARFGERLRIRYEVDEEADGMLPPLMLQPLVENAVRHGITTKENGGTVTISVREDSGFMLLTVEDDGIGMPDGARTLLSKEEEPKGGIGLRNIHLRLVKLFGTGVEIGSGVEGGTKVTIRIPKDTIKEGSS